MKESTERQNGLKILYISNSRKVDWKTIAHGHDAHLLYCIDSLRSTGNQVFLDTDFYVPFFWNPFNKDLSTYRNKTDYVKNSIDHFLALSKIPLVYVSRIHRLINRIQPDLIYERTRFFYYFSLSPAFLKKHRALYFLEVHAPPQELKDMNLDSYFYSLAENIERKKYAQAQKIFVVSNALRNHLIDAYGIVREKIHVLPNGVDTKVFYPDNELRIQCREKLAVTNKIVIGFVGTGNLKWHDLGVLCDVLRILKHNVSLDIAFLGVGLEKSDLNAQGIRLDGIENLITCVGKRSPQEVNAFINAMDICVLSGTNWYCSPMKLFEYGAVGKPVVTVDMPNVREIAQSDTNVIFFKKGDTYDLAEKIKLLLNSEDLQKKISTNLRNHIVSNFSWEKNAKKIVAIYHSLQKNYVF